MKTKGRSLLKAFAYCLAALCLIGLLVHTSRFKDAARRFIIKSLDDRLGGSSSVEHLDYRLWLGEIRGFGFAWSSAGEGVSVRVDELVLSFSPWDTTSVMVRSPEVRIRPGDSETGAPLRLLAGLFGIAVEVTDGLLILGDLELEDIESRVVPHDGSWEGSLATGRARLTARERFPVLDAVSARLRIGPTSAEVTDFRVEKGASYGTGTIRFESFAPLLAEANLTHTIEGSLVHEMMPEVVVDDPIVGEARFRRENDSWLGEGVLEATSVTFATSQAIGIRAPWRLEGELLFIEDAELSGYDGHARLSAKLDVGRGRRARKRSMFLSMVSRFIPGSGATSVGRPRLRSKDGTCEEAVAMPPSTFALIGRSPEWPYAAEWQLMLTARQSRYMHRTSKVPVSSSKP